LYITVEKRIVWKENKVSNVECDGRAIFFAAYENATDPQLCMLRFFLMRARDSMTHSVGLLVRLSVCPFSRFMSFYAILSHFTFDF